MLTLRRMIIYYPVSALVTLFANILQNPQDARARSDIRLMNQVVTFLSALSGDEETGGVKRMLGVCSEFERIARVVLDKAERESHSRRKRKNNADEEALKTNPPQTKVPEKRPLPRSPDPTSRSLETPNIPFSTPNFTGDLNNMQQPFNPSLNSFPSPTLTVNGDNQMRAVSSDFLSGADSFPNMMNTAGEELNANFPDMQAFGADGIGSPINAGSFQQPFVPQDLWRMPMTLEWDWADMSANTFPAVDDIGPGGGLGGFGS